MTASQAPGNGTGVLPCMGYMGMCCCEGHGFQAVYSGIGYIKVSATLKIAIFPYLRFQRFQIDMLESFLLKKNQKKILFLSKDIGGKRFFLVNYFN